MTMRDELGVFYQDEMFTSLFPKDGQPALARFLIGIRDDYAVCGRVSLPARLLMQ